MYGDAAARLRVNDMIRCPYPQRPAREWMALFNEYNSNDTTEARAVKDLDKFEMMLQAMEYESA